MLTIANAGLHVDLLDPVADRDRLGPRFCWGGYVWQVHDHAVGPLLTGPEWPKPAPAPHNGQGLPESFRHSTTTGQPLLWQGDVGFAPGIGALGRDAAGAVTVTEPCTWQTEIAGDRAVFVTKQTVNPWSCEVVRTVELRDRQLRSISRLTNHGAAPLALEWFAHPFFALLADGRLNATLPEGAQLENNPAYALAGRELTMRRAFQGMHDGHLVHLDLPAGQPFAVDLPHPHLTGLRFATDFAPFKCVLWANGNTLSFEPYLALGLAPNETRAWTLTYDFGPAR